jgi:hypothetical protein
MTVMAEPGRAADEIVAQDVGKTVAAPNSTPADAVDLAWSRDSAPVDDEDVQSEDIQSESAAAHQSWRATWRIAGALVVAGLVLAAAIVLGRWALTTTQSATKAANPSPAPTTPVAASTTATAPPSIASTPDQDDKYLQALNDKGISFANPEAAIYNGKTVCQNIGQGMTVPQVVAAFRASSPAFSNNADDFVAISVRAYCPQNSNLVAGS